VIAVVALLLVAALGLALWLDWRERSYRAEVTRQHLRASEAMADEAQRHRHREE
jgi:uncharacterized protein HemX